VLVGHGGLYRAMLPVVLSNIAHRHIMGRDFPNAAYVLAETRPGGLHCPEWCGAAEDTVA
jgi:hypothetical protein